MWMSLRCSTRSGRAPGGSSGTSTRRSVYCRVSQAAYAVSAGARDGAGADEAAENASGCHQARLPQSARMSTLKDRLRAT